MGQNNVITHHKDVKFSLNFGFLGLGMGGTSIAAACADIKTDASYPYKSILINSNEIDLEKIHTENEDTIKMLIGDGKGASRDINLGESIFKGHEKLIADQVNVHFADRDFIWIVAGLGGGTGTGSIIEAIRVLMTNNFQKKFGLILTLPRDSEGPTVLSNALARLQMINNAMQGLGSIIIVDNQKLFNRFIGTENKQSNASIKEYLAFSNTYIAETLHDINVVTASYSPFGENHFDSSEFEKLIKTPGVLHFVRYETNPQAINFKKPIEHLNVLQKHIDNGVLSDGFNMAKTARFAVSILANSNQANNIFKVDFIKSIEDRLNEIAPIAAEKPIAQYIYPQQETSSVFYYAAFAGLGLPNRVKELIKESNRLLEEKKKIEQPESDIFSGFVQTASTTPTQELDGADAFAMLFNSSETNAETTSSISDEDKAFNDLFGNKPKN